MLAYSAAELNPLGVVPLDLVHAFAPPVGEDFALVRWWGVLAIGDGGGEDGRLAALAGGVASHAYHQSTKAWASSFELNSIAAMSFGATERLGSKSLAGSNVWNRA